MHVDIAIIGGGVAGLATALSLRQQGLEAVVFEQARTHDPEAGMGFLLMPNGLEALARLGLAGEVRNIGRSARCAEHRSPTGDLRRDAVIPEHLGLMRGYLLEVLLRALPPEAVRTDMIFAGFDGSGACRQARFANGERVTAQVFVGADGIASPVRLETCGQSRERPTSVRELVAILRHPMLVERYGGRLFKLEDRSRRRILGLFAVGGDKILWYLRWDQRDQDLADLTQETKRAFVTAMTAAWPQPVAALVRRTDFNHSVVLDSVLVDLPPSFAHDNVVLIGDAAHPLIRLTTQGVNSALEDSVVLAELLAQAGENFEEALQRFSEIRLPHLRQVHADGRRKIEAFLGSGNASAAESSATDHSPDVEPMKSSGAR